MKTVLVGAVEGSGVALAAMCDSGHAPALVVTLPPELASRHSDFFDLGVQAADHGIPVHHTRNSNLPETLATIAAVKPDFVLVIGWSQLCGPEFRAIASRGTLGFHPSALPKLRGRAVVPWTILTGAEESGATLFWLAEGADTGDIAAQDVFPIDPDAETARSLYDRHMAALRRILPELLNKLAAGDIPRIPQDHSKATICAKRVAEDGLIDWLAPAEDIHRLIRAVGEPYPCAFTHDANGTQITIIAARLHSEPGKYIGLPGQVQEVGDHAFLVMCGDGVCIEITKWSGPEAAPKIHSKLGAE